MLVKSATQQIHKTITCNVITYIWGVINYYSSEILQTETNRQKGIQIKSKKSKQQYWR